jgi:hypothetical protein
LTHAYPPYLNKAIPKNRHHPKKKRWRKKPVNQARKRPRELCCR